MQRNKKNILNVLGLLIIIVLFISAITNPAIKGFYWKATKGDDYIYLIGTTHAVEQNTNFLNKNLKKILEDTQALALEVNYYTDKKIIEEEKAEENDLKLEEGELKDFLTKKEQKKLDSLLDYFDVDYKDVADKTPYGFNRLIGLMLSFKSDLTDNGLDYYLASIYEEANKQIVSLESNKFQTSILKSGTEEFKDLVNSFDEKDMDDEIKFQKEFIEAFKDGNEDFFNETVNKYETEESIKINKYRNENMSNKIDELAKGNKQYAVAVGTYHFFGNDSIIKNLESKGYTINKIN